MSKSVMKRDPVSIIGIELLFTFLPFIVYGVVFMITNTPSKLFQLPEWAFAASIIFGQTIRMFLSTITSKRIFSESERPTFIIILLTILGFVPSLIGVLFMITANPPSIALIVYQLIMFILAVAVYLFFVIDLSADKDG